MTRLHEILERDSRFSIGSDFRQADAICPLCPIESTHKTLTICIEHGSPKYGAYYCPRCYGRGWASKILPEYFDIRYVSESPSSTEEFDYLKRYLYKLDHPVELCPVIDLNKISVPMDEYSREAYYCIERGISYEKMVAYDFRIGIDKLRDRIIIPTFNEQGLPIFYQGRSIYSDQIPKYMSLPGAKKSRMLYNYHRVTGNVCILCEGSISAIMTGRLGIATFGKQPSDFQIKMIANKFTTCYLAYDSDVPEADIYVTIDKLTKAGVGVYLVRFPEGHDPDSFIRTYSYAAFKELCRTAPVFRSGSVLPSCHAALSNVSVDKRLEEYRQQIYSDSVPS